MLQWISNNLSTIIFFLFIFSSVIGAVLRKLSEHKQEKAREQERRRRYAEAMRTGRVSASGEFEGETVQMPSESGPTMREDPRDRLRRLAEQRKAEIEAMRQRRAGSGGAGRGGSVAQPRPTMAPGSPAAGRGSQPSQSSSGRNLPPRRPSPTVQRQAGGRPKESPRAASKPLNKTAEPLTPIDLGGDTGKPGAAELAQALMTPGGVATGGGVGRRGTAGSGRARAVTRGLSRGELRRAIILKEVLDSPIALRETTGQ